MILAFGDAAGSCVGDCNGDGGIAINALARVVGLAIGVAPLAQCPIADANGAVDTADLVTAVRFSLNGCPCPPCEADLRGARRLERADELPSSKQSLSPLEISTEWESACLRWHSASRAGGR